MQNVSTIAYMHTGAFHPRTSQCVRILNNLYPHCLLPFYWLQVVPHITQARCSSALCGPYPHLLQNQVSDSCGSVILLAISNGPCECWPTMSSFPIIRSLLSITICMLVNLNNISHHLRGISMRERRTIKVLLSIFRVFVNPAMSMRRLV